MYYKEQHKSPCAASKTLPSQIIKFKKKIKKKWQKNMRLYLGGVDALEEGVATHSSILA